MLSHWDGMGWDRVCCDCSVLFCYWLAASDVDGKSSVKEREKMRKIKKGRCRRKRLLL